MSTVLQAQQLQLGYRGQSLGAAFDFTLRQGETLVLLGANGSGKSTLIKTLLGLLPAIAGQIVLNHKPLSHWTMRQRARQLAYVPQHLHGELSFLVIEIVLMARSGHGSIFATPNRNDQQIAHDSLHQLGIGHLASHNYNRLSGGQQQLVLLARAMAQQAPILIMDEPTSSLDFANQILVLEQIGKLRQQGRSILLCTHQPRQAQLLADRIAYCKQGAIIAQGQRQEMLEPERLAALYNLSVSQLHKYFSAHAR